jgi:GxxExxY protein
MSPLGNANKSAGPLFLACHRKPGKGVKRQKALNQGCAPMDTDESKTLDRVTELIIGSAYRVQNTLGNGFLEKTYENALSAELQLSGSHVEQQVTYNITYRAVPVGTYIADLVVDHRVLVEIKAYPVITGVHRSQCLNYLKCSGLPVCLLLNFGNPKVEVRRFSNQFSLSACIGGIPDSKPLP